MSPEAQRIAIAEACGTHTVSHGMRPHIDVQVTRLTDKNGKTSDIWAWGSSTDTGFMEPAHYLGDLNAMHEAEKELTGEQWGIYEYLLKARPGYFWHATAAQRAEAFLRTVDRWTQ